jgi:hypothetical protein
MRRFTGSAVTGVALAVSLGASSWATPRQAPAPTSYATDTFTAQNNVDLDARCLLTMATLSGLTDLQSKRLGPAGVLYYAGRIAAEDPVYDLGARLPNVAHALKGQSVKAEADRCAPTVLRSMSQLHSAQQALSPPPPRH